MKQNPFSLYDFLGYVIPGALALMLIGFFSNGLCLKSLTCLYHSALKFFGPSDPQGVMKMLEETVVFVIFAYVAGHLVAYLSSLTVEKFSYWVYGYPSRFLVEEVPSGHYWRVGQCSTGDCGFVWPENREQRLDLFCRILIGIFLWPLSLCTYIFSKNLNVKSFFVKMLDQNLIEAINKKKEKLGTKLGGIDMDKGDYHRVIYHYEYEKQDKHHIKMDNYVALYGFLRAMCFIANCATLWITYRFLWPSKCHCYCHCPNSSRLWIIVIGVVVTYIFFMAFIKFYRRFTLESFMCLIVDTSLEDKGQQ